MFKDQFDATEDAGTKLGVFCTGPSVPNTFRNLLSEAVGTFVLVFAIKGKGTSNFAYGWIPVVGPIIGALLAVGLYAIIPW